jgi:hypothetical protein
MAVASASGLQEEQDVLLEQLPALPFDCVPRGVGALQHGDVLALASAAGGKAERQAAAQLLAKAAAAEGVAACELCGRRGEAAAPASAREAAAAGEDARALLFTASTSLAFASRRVRVLCGAFLCGRCRAARDPLAFTRLLVPPLPGGAPDDAR